MNGAGRRCIGCGGSRSRDTPGEMLRAERERRGYSVQQAAEELHLDAWVIEAIEANRFEALGAPVYARGHLRKYAALLGLSPATVIERYEALSDTPVEPTPVPAAIRSACAWSSVVACRSCRCGSPLRLRSSLALAWLAVRAAVDAELRRRDDQRGRCAEPCRQPTERAGRAGRRQAPVGSSAGTGRAGASGGSNVERPAAAKFGCAWSSPSRRGPRSTTPPGKRLMFDMGDAGPRAHRRRARRRCE